KVTGSGASVARYPRQGSAGQGVRAITIIPKGGLVKLARVVNPDDDLVVISTNGQVIRMFADGIPHKGRPAQGVAVMNMREGDEVASITRVPRTDKSGKMIGDDELAVLSEDEADDRNGGEGSNGGSPGPKAEPIAKLRRVAATNGRAKGDGTAG